MADGRSPTNHAALCTSYPPIRTWRITRAQTGLSPPAGYLSIHGIELHSNVVINLGITPTLTRTTLALRKDTHIYPGP